MFFGSFECAFSIKMSNDVRNVCHLMDRQANINQKKKIETESRQSKFRNQRLAERHKNEEIIIISNK